MTRSPFLMNRKFCSMLSLDDAGSLSKRRSAPETREIEIEEAIAILSIILQ
ncbi:hypothetical protein NDA03_20950 [Trichocoleus sp. Lan]|uniref:hypothetical protein n=1 Tax=Trichocoleus sp. Lan TaxID=2933927 RepID=UPI0032974A4F